MNYRLRTVLQLLCKGLTNPEIARLMGIKERTVKYYVSQLFSMFEVTNRTELAGLLANRGLEGPAATASIMAASQGSQRITGGQ